MNVACFEIRLDGELGRQETVECRVVQRLLVQKAADWPVLAPVGPLSDVVERNETFVQAAARLIRIVDLVNVRLGHRLDGNGWTRVAACSRFASIRGNPASQLLDQP